MSYNILTETAFFKVINDLGGKMEMEQIQEEYHQFVTQVIDLCHHASESKEALHALVFAETELPISSTVTSRYWMCSWTVYQESPVVHS